MLQVLCQCIVDTVIPKKLQRGVSWGGIDIGFLVFSDELLQRACFAKLWWMCSPQAITLKTLWSIAFIVFSPGGQIPPAPLTFTSGCLYIGNLSEWFSNKRVWPAGSDARNGLVRAMRVAVLNGEDGSGIVDVCLYGMVLWESSVCSSARDSSHCACHNRWSIECMQKNKITHSSEWPCHYCWPFRVLREVVNITE